MYTAASGHPPLFATAEPRRRGRDRLHRSIRHEEIAVHRRRLPAVAAQSVCRHTSSGSVPMTRRFRRCRSADVLTPTFAAVAILFCSLMFVAYVIDRAVNATDWAKRLDNSHLPIRILHQHHHSSGCRHPVPGALGHGRHYPHARTQDDQHLGSHGATRDRCLDAVPFHVEVRRGRDHGAIRVCRGGIWRLPHDGLPDLPWRCRISRPDRCQKPVPVARCDCRCSTPALRSP